MIQPQSLPCQNKNSSSLLLEQRIRDKLTQRILQQSIRSIDLCPNDDDDDDDINNHTSTIDFCSNDYLGLAHSVAQHDMVELKMKDYTSRFPPPYLGSTGSRLLSGNSALCVQLEGFLASVHHRPAALICNSGYDANLSLLSSLPLFQDVVIMDELCHNSLIMGVQMSRIQRDHIWYFQHNNMLQLEQLLIQAKKYCITTYSGNTSRSISSSSTSRSSRSSIIFVVVESVYSMDGDIAPLQQVLDLSLQYHAHVIVDEAHGLGVYGRANRDFIKDKQKEEEEMDKGKVVSNSNAKLFNHNNGGTGVLAALDLEGHPALLAGIFTFGKAAGCHGAVITGPHILMEYLVNYARPFIYSTSLPPHSLITIQCAYDTILGQEGEKKRDKVFHLVQLFRSKMMHGLELQSTTATTATANTSRSKRRTLQPVLLLPSPSPIQAIMCPGNDHCVRVARRLRRQGGIGVFAIRSPTVPKGQERIRIILHAHNTEDEVLYLVKCLLKFTLEEEEEEEEELEETHEQEQETECIRSKL